MLKDILLARALAGGGSGGVSSWNDLTDKPFGEEEAYLLSETKLDFVASEATGGMAVAVVEDGAFAFSAVVGDVYTVNFNGVDYECVAVGESSMTIFLGNMGIAGGEDSGEPFFIQLQPSGNMVIPANQTLENAIVSIKGTLVKTMDRRYVPDVNLVDLTKYDFDVNSNGSYVSAQLDAEDFVDVKELCKNGRVWLRLFVTGTFIDGGSERRPVKEKNDLLATVRQCTYDETGTVVVGCHLVAYYLDTVMHISVDVSGGVTAHFSALRSPSGNAYKITVSDDGTLTATAI